MDQLKRQLGVALRCGLVALALVACESDVTQTGGEGGTGGESGTGGKGGAGGEDGTGGAATILKAQCEEAGGTWRYASDCVGEEDYCHGMCFNGAGWGCECGTLNDDVCYDHVDQACVPVP